MSVSARQTSWRWMGNNTEVISDDRHGRRLPCIASSFVGREADQRALSELMDSARVVTITGAAGVGKSRLALEVARANEPRFPGGVWLCGLAEVRESRDLVRVLSRSLGLDGELVTGRDLGRALAYWGPALVVWDGCDELDEGAVGVLDDCIRATELRVLVTSRVPLSLPGERRFDLAPLPTSERDGPASQLFLDRARSTIGFDATHPESRRTIHELVRRLDGLPLALELTASLMGVLHPADVLAKTDLLLDVPPPNESRDRRPLRFALTLSWGRLADTGRTALATIAVFRGGFDLAAATDILRLDGFDEASTLVVLRDLRDQSFLRVERHETRPGEVRYRLFESVRAFAAEKLAESGRLPEIVSRHSAYFGALAVQAVREGEGDARLPWIARMLVDEENVEAAARAGLSREADATAAVAATTGLLWLSVGRGPLGAAANLARKVAERCLSSVTDDRQRVLFELWAATVHRHVGDLEGSARLIDACIVHSDALGDDKLRARALIERARLQHFVGGDDDVANEMLSRAEAWAGGAGDIVTSLLAQFARLAHATATPPANPAARYADLCKLAERTKDPHLIARAQSQYAAWLGANGRCEDAFRALDRVKSVGEALRQGSWVTLATAQRGLTLQAMGNFDGARAEFEAALRLSRETGFIHSQGECFCYLGLLDVEEGRYEAALDCFDEAERLLPPSAHERALALVVRAVADAALGRVDSARTRLAESLERTRTMSDTAHEPIAMLALVVDLVLSRTARSKERAMAAWNAVAALDGLRGSPSFARRFAERLLRSARRDAVRIEDSLVIGGQAAWFELPGGSRHSLEHRPVLRSLLWHLVRFRMREPTQPVPRDRLVELVWPNEKMGSQAAVNRLNVALSSLRSLGFKAHLVAEAGGIRLHEELLVVIDDDDAESADRG
jgi:predicted ATPase/tetratricopeptide (TPR) repeat protein